MKYLTSIVQQAGGDMATTYLCRNLDDNSLAWRQSFEMNGQWWDEVYCKTDLEVLAILKEDRPELVYFLDHEDDSKIYVQNPAYKSTHITKSGITLHNEER